MADALRGMGHRVSTPTQTGVGERKHLLSKNITLDSFAADMVNHIEAEELDDVILVGQSLGGISITCAADKIPGRIRHVVYLDSFILQNNQSIFDILPPEVVAARRKLVGEQGNDSSLTRYQILPPNRKHDPGLWAGSHEVAFDEVSPAGWKQTRRPTTGLCGHLPERRFAGP